MEVHVSDKNKCYHELYKCYLSLLISILCLLPESQPGSTGIKWCVLVGITYIYCFHVPHRGEIGGIFGLFCIQNV